MASQRQGPREQRTNLLIRVAELVAREGRFSRVI